MNRRGGQVAVELPVARVPPATDQQRRQPERRPDLQATAPGELLPADDVSVPVVEPTGVVNALPVLA
ncbi:MAG: hypothetical protein HC915_16465 [Anaerolineae bacterium]|nr:hypothetical protein [Anaerolineae bacterium]